MKHYSKKKTTNLRIQKMFLNIFSQNLKSLQQADLITEINREGVERAITGTKTGKTPGPDGLSIKFYKKSWHVIGPDLIKLYHNIFKNGKIPTDTKKGYICLFYKNGPKDIIGNY